MLAAAIEPVDGLARDHAPAPLGLSRLYALQVRVVGVVVVPAVREYLVALGAATQGHRQFHLGLGPRGLLTWQRLAQAHAFLDGREFVTPDDVQEVARPVLEVRLGVEPEVIGRVLDEILAGVRVPA